MPDKLHACPNCQATLKKSLLGGAFFPVYRCSQCQRRYCYQCPASRQGKECPACGSEKRTVIAEVYAT